jgi:hypothetical protein
MDPPLSVLDLVPVRAGSTPREAMLEAVELAREAERLGFARYGFAEYQLTISRRPAIYGPRERLRSYRPLAKEWGPS